MLDILEANACRKKTQTMQFLSSGPLFLLPAARAPGERRTEDDVRQDPFGKVTELHPQGAIGGIRIAPSGCSEDIGPTSVPGSDQLKPDSEWLGHTNGALRKPGEA